MLVVLDLLGPCRLQTVVHGYVDAESAEECGCFVLSYSWEAFLFAAWVRLRAGLV